MRYQRLVRIQKDLAKKAVDDWLKKVPHCDPLVSIDKLLHREYLAMAKTIKVAIERGDKALRLSESRVSHLPTAALAIFDRLNFQDMYNLVTLKIPAAMTSPDARHAARHLEINSAHHLTELTVEHPLPGLISAALSNMHGDNVCAFSEPPADGLHVGIHRCVRLVKLDLSGTAATALSIQSSVGSLSLVAPPKLCVLHGRVPKSMDPQGHIFTHLLNNQALHLVTPSRASAESLTSPAPVSTTAVLCLGEIVYLFHLLNTNRSLVEQESVPLSLCIQQAVYRGLFGPVLRQCLGPQWLDTPELEDVSDPLANDNPALPPELAGHSIHGKLTHFTHGSGAEQRAQYCKRLVEFLGDWLPLRRHLHSRLKREGAGIAATAGIKGHQAMVEFLAESDRGKASREDWIREHLHVGYDILPESPPPEFNDCPPSNQDALRPSVVKGVLCRPSSPYNSQILIHVRAIKRGEGDVTRITPRAVACGTGDTAPSIAEYDIAIEAAPHRASVYRDKVGPAYFSVPPHTSTLRLFDTDTGHMEEFVLPQEGA
jgi:hypothetical protein